MDFFCGCIGGLVGQLCCYPFDTIKSRYQMTKTVYNPWKDFRNAGFLQFYRGVSSPLVSVILEKSILFGSYGLLSSNNNNNGMINGLSSGLISTLVVVPFERIKIYAQTFHERKRNRDILMSVIKRDGILSLYRGWTATLFREVPGYGIYFTSYESYKRCTGRNSLCIYESFVLGSLCGISAWLFIYPSDPIKTRMQYYNIGFRQATKDIWMKSGVRGFYSGFVWGLLRAGILHGGVFVGYEQSKNYLY